MKKFEIGDKYIIFQFDDLNWAVGNLKKFRYIENLRVGVKNASTPPATIKKGYSGCVLGYHSTLQSAKESLAETCAKSSKDFKELEKWISKIKEV